MALTQAPLRPRVHVGPELRQAIGAVLGFNGAAAPTDVRCERTWQHDGLIGEEVSWSVGYGPRTMAWILRPRDTVGPLPGVVALHSHDGIKTYGKEKIADGPDPTAETVAQIRAFGYGGRAFANALAHKGFVVVVPDVFMWASRRFPAEVIPERLRTMGRLAAIEAAAGPEEPYERAARLQEDLVSKYCGMLGTSFAGVVAYEDRAAVAYLRGRPDVSAGPVGCVGLSGGGSRAALLQATCDDIGAAVIVGMMTTHTALVRQQIDNHTWMLIPPGLGVVCDWPDLAASRAPSPLLVQYDVDDLLFTLDGMRAADALIAGHYQQAGRPEAYTGQFYDGPHKFDQPMQEAAFEWLADQLPQRTA